MTELSPTPRSTVRRLKERARTDRRELFDVLDAGLICHLGVVMGGSPVVLPTGYGRDGNTMYLHGSTGSASLRAAAEGADVSVTVTHVDGIVHARAVMHFSMNYRSAVVHGRLRPVTEPAEKLRGLRVIVDHLAPGSWDYAREPNRRELAATAVFALDLTEASVKVRTGGPSDDAEDIAAGGIWAGVVPLHQVYGVPEPATDIELPAHIAAHSPEAAHEPPARELRVG